LASKVLALNPPIQASPLPRILLIADVPNWIFDRHAHLLQARFSDEFTIDIAYHGQPVDETRYDLIHPMEWHMADPSMIRTPAKWVTGIRSHVSWEGWKLSDLCARLAHLYQGGVYVVSQRLLEIFRPLLPEVVALPHGVDTVFFTSSHPPKARNRKLRVGWAGNRASSVKGFDAFIAPLGKLPGVELVHCGYSDRMLTQAEMRGFYEDIDAYICTSTSEGHNNSLMEAASMARAIVTTDVGTVPEFLQDGVSALIVKQDVKAISHAVLRLRDNPKLRKQLGAKARESVIQRFEWSLRLEDYRCFFRKAINTVTANSIPEREAFLYEPDWVNHTWAEVVLSYVEAFQPGETVALILPLDGSRPGAVSLEIAQQAILELVSESGRDLLPDVILIEHPEELLETLRNFDHVQWIHSDFTASAALEGPLGIRFDQARKAMIGRGLA
jgi:glycosyltransferase involved in cell wall biosynthesis